MPNETTSNGAPPPLVQRLATILCADVAGYNQRAAPVAPLARRRCNLRKLEAHAVRQRGAHLTHNAIVVIAMCLSVGPETPEGSRFD